MCSYGGIEPIIWAIESFPPKVLTLVEHMQMNSTQIFLIGCSQCPPCSWGLGHHSTLCWQCVHTSLGSYTLCVINPYNITSNEDNAYLWFPLAFQVQYRDFYLLFYHLNAFSCGLQGSPVANKYQMWSGSIYFE